MNVLRPAMLDERAAVLQERPVPVNPTRRQALHATAFVDVDDQRFASLQRAYAHTGGIRYADEVADLLRRHSRQPISTVARWIVNRSIVSFQWRSQRFFPMFQFLPADMSLRPGLVDAVGELSAVFDDWELASWFAQANAWLDDMTPADAIALKPSDVVNAARADRFIACN